MELRGISVQHRGNRLMKIPRAGWSTSYASGSSGYR